MSFYNNVNVLRYELTTEGLCLLEGTKVSVADSRLESISRAAEEWQRPGQPGANAGGGAAKSGAPNKKKKVVKRLPSTNDEESEGRGISGR